MLSWDGSFSRLDGLQSPARGEGLKESMSRMGGVGYDPTGRPHSPGDVQVKQRWDDASKDLLSRVDDTL